jgi:iron uptake system component EfeO
VTAVPSVRGTANRLTVLVLIPVALALGACGGATGTPGATNADGSINVSAHEFRFDPSTLSASAGTVQFRVTDAGSIEHEFEVITADGGVAGEIEGLVPGVTRTLSVNLAPGSYRYACRLPGHEQAGMHGTLTVTGT